MSESRVSCLMSIDNDIGIKISMGKEKVHEQPPE